MKFLFIIIHVFLGSLLFAQKGDTVQILTNGIKITPPNGKRMEGLQFGWSVDVSNKYVFVGTPFYNTNRYDNLGMVYIFKHENNSFKPIISLAPSVLSKNMFYGECIKFNNGIVAAASSGSNYLTQKGAKKLFGTIELSTPLNLLTNTKNVNTRLLVFKGTKTDVHFGDKIDISDNYVICNAPFLKIKIILKVSY